MTVADNLGWALRLAGCFQLLFLTGYFVRRGKAGFFAAFFCATLICYLVAPLLLAVEGFLFLKGIVFAGAVGVSFAFWILAQAVFEDNFRSSLWHWGIFILIEALSGLALIVPFEAVPVSIQPVARLFPQVVYLALVVITLVQVQSGLKSDLVETRRRFRRIFIMVSGVYILLVLGGEIAWKGSKAPDFVETMNVASIVALTYYFSFRMLEMKPRLLIDPDRSAPDEGDRALGEKIDSLMKTHKLYRRDDLTAAVIAAMLAEQEYKVRRSINGVLGYRNFYDFLNRYRIEEASAVLMDPASASIPVLRIAMDCGYGSLAPFNRAFKAAKGVSPTAFRKSAADSSGLHGRI